MKENRLDITYWGQEGFLFEYNGIKVVVDPYLTDYVDKNCSQLVKWERKYAPPITAEELDFVDYVFLTHTHYDHADPWTIKGILKVNDKAKFIVPAPEKDVFLSYGIPEDRLILAKEGQTIDCGEIKANAVAAAHEDFHTNENGDYFELGYKIAFGNIEIYHAGDTLVYDGLVEKIKNADIAFLPINGRDYYRHKLDILGNPTLEEAAILAKEANVSMVVPMHHDLYAVNGEKNSRFVDTLEEIYPTAKFHIFRNGEKFIFIKG